MSQYNLSVESRLSRLSRLHRTEPFWKSSVAVSGDVVSVRLEWFTVRHVRVISDMLKETARAMLKNTGHEEITLSSLSSSDYNELEEIVTFLIDEFQHTGSQHFLAVSSY